ncbi:flagellar hook-associated 2 domain protein [Candidatus Scalindua japonica]|uniref:Filament cap protein n=1 Tax=Candidatus Scalindua japonica TaxID=1284222 RepID=A0A286TVW0_9BACT|nr:flagellar filament capping protein FliD [Candidatus Scalindua japonica]GAX60020.1 flagellar hook-associated 2 domain protein [Candidatus Scalindua japonica]
MPGTSAIGGLVSGLDTATLIEQLIGVSRKRVDIVVNNQTLQSDKLTAFKSLNTQLSTFQAKAKALTEDDIFDVFKTSTSTNSTNFSSDELVSISTTSDASPGTHTISFTSSSQLAQARQMSSMSFTSSSTALGLTGEFVINGNAISISTTDSLSDVISSINTANSGTNATGVTATLISVSDTDNRMVLTSDNTGEDKFSILDASSDAEDILEAMGLASSTQSIKNATSDGAKSDAFSSSSTAVQSLLGLTTAQNGTVTIGGESVVIDLSSQSLSTIATNINTALTGASKGTATVASTTTDGVTTYQIDINGTTSYTDTNNILETLGIIKRGQSSVAEEHTGSTANTKTSGAGGGVVASATTFSEINTGSDANNVANNDTVTLTGTNHDGNAVTGTYTITDKTTDTIDGLLTQIENTFGLGAGSATIDASGKVIITDDTTGDSQLSIEIITNNEGGGTLDFGTVSVTTEGYDMEVTAGQDAKITIDGIAVSRSSNSIDDVISGVTLDLNRVESGSTVNLTISRDTDSIKSSVNDFATAYNDIIEFINQEFAFNEDSESAGILSGESTLRTIKSIIQSTISASVPLLPTDSNALSLIGITSDKYGKLSVKDSTFLKKINSDFYAVKRMFVAEGTTTNTEISYISHTKDTVAGNYAVSINTVASQASETGSIVLTNGIGAGLTDTLTITDTATNRVATISLDGNASENGSTIDNIVNAINSELDTERTQTLVGSIANTKTTGAGGGIITASTKFNEINTGGDANDLSDNDVISFTGTNRSGLSISNSYTISDVSTGTVQDFLSTIEKAYENSVSATINASGNIVLTDITDGDSQVSISITEPGSLNFGSVKTSNEGGVTGRYGMEITASNDGSDHLVLTHDTYGSGFGFTTVEINDLLGTEGTYSGTDVAGTINGEAATGTGQILVGDAPSDTESSTSIEDLTLKVTSTTTGTKGNVKLTMGVGELMHSDVDSIIDQFDGLLTIRMDGLQDTIDDMQNSILGMEERLAMETLRLNEQFVALELNLSKLQSVSSFMAQQLGMLGK